MNIQNFSKLTNLSKSLLGITSQSFRIAVVPPQHVNDGELSYTQTCMYIDLSNNQREVKGVMLVGLRGKEITTPYDTAEVLIIPSKPITVIDFENNAMQFSTPTVINPTGKWSLFNGERDSPVEVTLLIL